MTQRTVTIAARSGLHARPAALFSRAAAAVAVPVSIAKAGGEAVAAGSVLSVMTLGAEHGDEVVLSAEGEGADAALDELVALLASDGEG